MHGPSTRASKRSRKTSPLDASVLRYSNVYGPRQDPHGEAGVVAVFLDSALADKTLSVFAKATAGDGGCVRDYVFVSDVARANLQALAGELPHVVMNVGSGHPTTTFDLAERIIALTESRSTIE